ncbi:MAG: hypothetical protein A2Y15_07695 [Clostridiales bacterium GWF2_36_10]|nr:MAG: hypothetical protein A2Y15_07695 [Clostridiales bacterium GWF2_36_10]HAN21061.1 hypothetical protein [Clostridiales bacterium]
MKKRILSRKTLIKLLTFMLCIILLSVNVSAASIDWPYIGNDNLVTGGMVVYSNVGVYVYKNSTIYANHIKGFTEPYAGAHYYVQSSYSNTYSSASATVDLSSIQINQRNSLGTVVRNAYICLGYVTAYRTMDIGLANTGNGWCAYAWGPSATPVITTNMGVVDSTATTVTFSISVSRVSGKDITEGNFTFKNSSGVTVLTSYVKYSETAGNVFTVSGNKPNVRFVRFMSLVPFYDTLDDMDNTYLNATISNCKLGNTNWSDSLIEYAWSVQGANINILKISTLTAESAGTNADYIEIIHRYQLH